MRPEQHEADAIAHVTDRLKSAYAHRPPGEIEAAVAVAHAHLDNRPIRDFIPILVEREARKALHAAGRS
ncbi:three-helix bundle dimerization domain-containing protein [Streptomyces sp. NPDC057284]|uniref:three-helix bundle dimerization domain-containing protein n=1 Tax=Streptomyces sp. NPDC057284 TaxID=3346083 RepID=UPI003642C6F1